MYRTVSEVDGKEEVYLVAYTPDSCLASKRYDRVTEGGGVSSVPEWRYHEVYSFESMFFGDWKSVGTEQPKYGALI